MRLQKIRRGADSASETEKKLNNPWVVGILAVFCCALWGSAFPFIKIGYRLFSIPADAPGSQILFAGIRFTLAGCLAGLAGVVLANLDSSRIGLDMTLTGEGFVLLSVVCYAFSSVLMKIYSRDDDPVMLSGYQFIAGGIVLSAACSVLFYLAFLSAAAYTIWGILLKYNPVSNVAIYGFCNPVIGVFPSALMLGEGGQAFTLKNLGALGLVCVGILIVNKLGASPKAAAKKEGGPL